MRSRRNALLVAAPVALLAALVAVVVFSVQRTLSRAGRAAAAQHLVAFTRSPFQPETQAAGPGFEPIASAPSFTTGVSLGGELYLAGPGGVSVFSREGALRRTLRPGIELPVAPVVAVAEGRLRGASEAQVLLATAGAGVLLLTPHGTAAPTLEQLIAARPEANDLSALLPLASGDLLLGTRHCGLLLFNGDTLAPVRFDLPGVDAARLEITALAAPDSTSWLAGTRNIGVLYSHAGTVSLASVAAGLPDNQIDSLAVYGSAAFAGTPLGIAEFDLGAPSFRPTRTLAPGVFAHALAITADGLAAGTLDQGVEQVPLKLSPRLRNASITAPLDASERAPAQRIDAFLPRAGLAEPLLALGDGTLLRRSGSTWAPALPSPPEALTDRNVSALAFTPAGELYVGFFDHGLDIFNPENPAAPPRHLEDDHLFCLNRLLLDPARGTIAAATANGLVLFDSSGTPRQVFTRRDGLLSDHVSDFVFTPAGLAVASPAGITFVGASGTESLYAFQGLVNNHVYALATQPGSSRLLAGTLGGLSLLEARQVRRNFTINNSALGHNWITALAPLPDGGFLVGTYGAGVERMSAAGSFSAIDLPANAPHDLVVNPNALLATSTHLYAGTLGHGLLVYTNRSARWSLVTAGLPSLNVTAFAARNGVLYIGTENGLVRIAEAKL